MRYSKEMHSLKSPNHKRNSIRSLVNPTINEQMNDDDDDDDII